MRQLCNILNNHCFLSYFKTNAEPHKITSHLRAPGSPNSKTGDTIKLKKISSYKYTIQDILNGYMPPLPDWYERYKTKQGQKKKKKPTRIYSWDDFFQNRLKSLEIVQEIRDKGYRERLCYYFLVDMLAIRYGAGRGP